MSIDSTWVIVPAHREAGIKRLMRSPLDLVSLGARVWTDPEGQTGAPAHRALFEAYREALDRVIPEARRIWLAMIDEAQKKIPDRLEALRNVLGFQPAGAAFDARVTAVVRKFWLAVDALNATVAPGERVSPQHFVLEWLIRARQDAAVDVLAGMPFWPIGLDVDGNWV